MLRDTQRKAPVAARDTMLAWERFLTGEPEAAVPLGNFVVSSWRRSLQLGVNPAGRAAPIAASGDDLHALRERHFDLRHAATSVFADVAELLDGSRSIMILTDADGIVLDAAGDDLTLEQGQGIHLTMGGAWRSPPAAPPRSTLPSISARASNAGPVPARRYSSRGRGKSSAWWIYRVRRRPISAPI